MPSYLRQDAEDPRGYVSVEGQPKPTEAAMALTSDGKCVFGDPQTGWAPYGSRSSLTYYDDEVERQRRLVCDTTLGQLILDNPKFAQPAVNAVTTAIEAYWQIEKPRLAPEAAKTIVTSDGKHVSNPTSFGRLAETPPSAQSTSSGADPMLARIDGWVEALRGDDLPKIMNVHDTFLKIRLRLQSKGLTKALTPKDVANASSFREDWYDDPDKRGRANRNAFTPTGLPGLITDDFTIPYVQAMGRSGIDRTTMRYESRNRGTDMFMIDAKKMRPEFREMLGEHNLVFAASASGSTSTLLASAETFVPGLFSNPEMLKHYLMGCVAYLVGGGMHTCHEVFYTGGCAGQRVGLRYTPGKYLGFLPDTFKGSTVGTAWAAEFWEIVRPDRPSPR